MFEKNCGLFSLKVSNSSLVSEIFVENNNDMEGWQCKVCNVFQTIIDNSILSFEISKKKIKINLRFCDCEYKYFKYHWLINHIKKIV